MNAAMERNIVTNKETKEERNDESSKYQLEKIGEKFFGSVQCAARFQFDVVCLFNRLLLSCANRYLVMRIGKKRKKAALNTGNTDIPRIFFWIQWRQSHRLEHCYRHVHFIGLLLKFTPRFRCSSKFLCDEISSSSFGLREE